MAPAPTTSVKASLWPCLAFQELLLEQQKNSGSRKTTAPATQPKSSSSPGTSKNAPPYRVGGGVVVGVGGGRCAWFGAPRCSVCVHRMLVGGGQ
jgi:hypothetical protein